LGLPCWFLGLRQNLYDHPPWVRCSKGKSVGKFLHFAGWIPAFFECSSPICWSVEL
jgi:hypothetical protein